MLEKPDLVDERVIASLASGYDLRVNRLAFLPLGADVNTAVYRADTADGAAFFVKLRRGVLDELSVTLPAALSGLGHPAVIAPVPATTGPLWFGLEPYTLTVYPFVAGVDGYTRPLSERQWVEFGSAVKRLHTARLPEAVRRALPLETYSPRWREQVRGFQAQLQAGRAGDPVAVELAAVLQAQAAVVTRLVAAAERLGQRLCGQPSERCVCHADLHAGNLLLGRAGVLYLVDWDTALLAPKERDLMFVGSGLGPGWDQPQTAVWFYQGYGPATIDPAAVAYYRCERIVQDLAEFCEQVLLQSGDGPDRHQAIHYLKSQFQPRGVADLALQSLAAVTAASLS